MAGSVLHLLTVVLPLLVNSPQAFTAAKEGQCVLPIGSKEDWLIKWPLVFKTNGQLYETTSSGIIQVNLEDGNQALLSCGPNYIKSLGRTEWVKVTCQGSTGNLRILSEGPDHGPDAMAANKFGCDLRVIEEIVRPSNGGTGDECSFTATQFGYVNPGNGVSSILGESCYDSVKGRTLYAHIKLGGNEQQYLQQLPDQHYLKSHQHPDGRYKAELFRGLNFDEIYARLRQQLELKYPPNLKLSHFIDDSLLENEQLQSIKKLGWNYYVSPDNTDLLQALKKDIKNLSANASTALDIYVGSHGVLIMHGGKGQKLPMYLQAATERFPMPEFIWLLVKSHGKATVFVLPNESEGNNNAAAVNGLRDDGATICKSRCEHVTWLKETTKHSARDQIKSMLCCSYEDVKRAIDEIPGNLANQVKEMLL